jgi:hypothetical protein
MLLMLRKGLRVATVMAVVPWVVPAVAQYARSSVNLPSATTACESRFDLDGDGRSDLVAVFHRRVLVFFQKSDGTFPAAPDVEIGSGDPVPEEYAAVAIGRVEEGPGAQLILLGNKGVDYLTVAQMSGESSDPVAPKPLLRRNFGLSSGPTLQFLDVATDMDGDGQAELLLPNSDQIEIYRRDDGGTYTLSSRLTLPMQTVQRTQLRGEPDLLGTFSFEDDQDRSMVRTMPRLDRWFGIQFAVEDYTEPFLLLDFTRNGRLDLLTRSRLYVQDETGRFDGRPSSLYEQIATALVVQKRRLVTAPNLVDFNNDGRMDTFSVQLSAQKMSPRTDISVYLGRPDRSFGKDPDFVLRTRDLAYSDAVPIGDVNGDGLLDVALINLDFQASSASSQLKAYLRNGLDGRLCFYLWDARRGRYPETYAFAHPVALNYQIYGTRQLLQQQIFINGDADGDGRNDLILKTGPMEISAFVNLGGIKGFHGRPWVRLDTAPVRFSGFEVRDLNGDRRADILVSGYVEGQDDRTLYTFFISR